MKICGYEFDNHDGELMELSEEDSNMGILFRLRWESDVRLTAYEIGDTMHISVQKDNSVLYHRFFGNAKKRGEIYFDSFVAELSQSCERIAQGAYDRQKSHRERAAALVRERGLTGRMSNAKWHELIGFMGEEIPTGFLAYGVKWLDKSAEEKYEIDWSYDWSCEKLPDFLLPLIEYIVINPVSSAENTASQDFTKELCDGLKKHCIEYDITDGMIYVRGYI
ncbi:MAG: hypothetical protein K2O14_01185 [Oscillospiraceae bacterium]|nr:hypothetical protein [Oscillospiraceae bacterium]